MLCYDSISSQKWYRNEETFLVCIIAQELSWRKKKRRKFYFCFLTSCRSFRNKGYDFLQVKGKWTLQYMDSELDVDVFNIQISDSDLCVGFLALLAYQRNIWIFTVLFYHHGWKSSHYTGIVGSAVHNKKGNYRKKPSQLFRDQIVLSRFAFKKTQIRKLFTLDYVVIYLGKIA